MQYRNLSTSALVEHSVASGKGKLTEHGALLIQTGKYTGRSPNDKFVVQDDETRDKVSWGEVNTPIEPKTARRLRDKIKNYLDGVPNFIQDSFAGASKESRLAVRVITESAPHALFAKNMFIDPSAMELQDFSPSFTVLHAPYFLADPATDGTTSEAAVIVDFSNHEVYICGTQYAGEIKKSIFSVLNYYLPQKGIMGMHCSANRDDSGKTAIFFGLSGTGKTTLSADASRHLIGDDEHGWNNDGVFNFEGGCYAKVIRLSEQYEPEIFATTRNFGTLLENVVMNEHTGVLDLDDPSLTENTRASYNIAQIPNAYMEGTGNHPTDLVMLTADAFGVLPPLARLTPAQAMYHFLSGYTAKVAGTERGVTEPKAVFSACFGAPFMPLHPTVYADLLGKKIAEHSVRCWLLNTGWIKGPYGVGERISIAWTRAMLTAAISGQLDNVPYEAHPKFQFEVPKSVPNVPSEVLSPRAMWESKDSYDQKASELIGRFQSNFEQYSSHVSQEVLDSQPIF